MGSGEEREESTMEAEIGDDGEALNGGCERRRTASVIVD